MSSVLIAGMISKFATPSAMCPIYGPHADRDRPLLIGTGVLLDFGKARFLVTAAHVRDWFDQNSAHMYIPGKANGKIELLEVHDGFRLSPLPASGKREDDKYDCAYVRLRDDLADKVAAARHFLAFGLIDFHDRLEVGDHYLFAGYPCNREKTNYGKGNITPTPWSLLSVADGKTKMRRLGFSPAHHISMKYERQAVKNEAGEVVCFPKATGMSGGPVWKGEGPPSEWLKSNPVKLVGIGIEAREDEKVMIGVRIHVLTNVIAKENPDIAKFISIRM